MEDSVITVSVVAKEYSITVSEFDGGSVTADKQTVGANGSVKLTVTINEGYQLVKITVNGQTVSVGTDGTITISNVNENKTIVVETEKIGGTESGDNGSGSNKKGCLSSVSSASIAFRGMLFAAVAVIKKKREY